MHSPSASISLRIDGREVSVAAGTSVAAAIAMTGSPVTRRSVGGMPRAPLCGMGVCHECRVSIDGLAHQLACQTPCASGMHVLTAQSPEAQ
ncbi:(2Fe-2S)-binding protein [Rugamonas sp. CCM 8940]|uniref:(2Fe-2S)-binding protein n=1 Tax=Rugamonas sp. CCM 8940 TaxID=2765359 RepID=UPI0018F364B4|nr:(2Fe-2S)-binding protein [Rugamonas sp. CCM 8940]MBJ7311364.1 (2Fe-2S)-binding protein [Rugamonas sp. CCM 8940]